MVYVYDGSFDGFLTVIFDVYETKISPSSIVSDKRHRHSLFDDHKQITTDLVKSERVWKGIAKRSNKNVTRMIYLSFASELPDIEMTLRLYLEKLFADTTGKYCKNLLDDHAFALYQCSRKVSHEIHLFTGFVRFQETADGMLFAAIEPDHDIVSFLAPHFARRFGNQTWVIYDKKRDKGVFYQKPQLHEITLSDKQFDDLSGEIKENIKAADEDIYRSLWKAYYKAINIPERKNTRLMLRLMPRRYWKYLPEKQ